MKNKSHLRALYKLVTQKGKSFVRKYYVKDKDLDNIEKFKSQTTMDIHTDSFGNFSNERMKLHSNIVYDTVTKCPRAKKGERPKAVLLMGGAASGKSTVVNNYVLPKYGKDTFGVLNADDVKEALPEFESFKKENVKTAANRVHEESSMLSKKALSDIVMQNRNFIYDAVLSDPKKAEKIVKDLKANGYDVELVAVSIDTQVAYDRAILRALGKEGEEDGSGRYITEKAFFGGHRGVPNSFESIKGLVDNYRLYNNDVAWGQDPILVEDNGAIINQELKNKFISKKDYFPDLKKGEGLIPLEDFFNSYLYVKEGFDNDVVDSESIFKATKTIKDFIFNLEGGQSLGLNTSFGVNDLMDLIGDNREFQHYADAIVTDNEGKLLIIQRTKFDSFGAGKWCIPGGKVENGEFVSDAVKRELFEETGLICVGCSYCCLYRNDDGSFTHYFYCKLDNLEDFILDADEIQQYNYIGLDQIDLYDFLLDCGDRLKNIFNIPYKGKQLTEQELLALTENKLEKANTASSLENSYKKGCLMLDVDWINREGENIWLQNILSVMEDEDVYDEPGFGREHDSHITVLYGFDLKVVTSELIERILPDTGIVFNIKDVSYFESENYDVLKFGIESQRLIELNALCRCLPYENDFPDYKPHMTIAYLKKGRAIKYINSFKEFIGKTFNSTKFIYSHNNLDGQKTKTVWDVKGYKILNEPNETRILNKSNDLIPLSGEQYITKQKLEELYKAYQIGDISQKTGLKKVAAGKWVDPKTGKEVKQEEGKEQKDYSEQELNDFAKNSSEKDLQVAIKESPDPKIREAAHKELDRRSKEEAVNDDEGKTKEESEEIKSIKDQDIFNNYQKHKEKYKALENEKNKFKALKDISTEDLALLVGNSPFEGDFKLNVQSFGDDNSGGLMVSIDSEFVNYGRTIDIHRGKMRNEIECEYLNVKTKGQGLGTKIFANQVKTAQKLGINLFCTAAREEDKNGYYTWARLGYDFSSSVYLNYFLNSLQKSEDEEIKSVKSLPELMSFPKGQKWWKENGYSFSGAFDTSEGSNSMILFEEYLSKKKNI